MIKKNKILTGGDSPSKNKRYEDKVLQNEDKWLDPNYVPSKEECIREYQKIKDKITLIARVCLNEAYNDDRNKNINPEQRLRKINGQILGVICRRLKMDGQSVIDWLLWDYFTEIARIEIEHKK